MLRNWGKISQVRPETGCPSYDEEAGRMPTLLEEAASLAPSYFNFRCWTFDVHPLSLATLVVLPRKLDSLYSYLGCWLA
jgi:hypothetical protein